MAKEVGMVLRLKPHYRTSHLWRTQPHAEIVAVDPARGIRLSAQSGIGTQWYDIRRVEEIFDEVPDYQEGS